MLPLGPLLPSPSQYSGPSASRLLYLGDAVVGQSLAEPTVHPAHVIGQVGAILGSKGVSVLLLPPRPRITSGAAAAAASGPRRNEGQVAGADAEPGLMADGGRCQVCIGSLGSPFCSGQIMSRTCMAMLVEPGTLIWWLESIPLSLLTVEAESEEEDSQRKAQ